MLLGNPQIEWILVLCEAMVWYSVSWYRIWYINFHSRNLHSFEPKLWFEFGSKLWRVREWKSINYILWRGTEYLILLVWVQITIPKFFNSFHSRKKNIITDFLGFPEHVATNTDTKKIFCNFLCYLLSAGYCYKSNLIHFLLHFY